MNGLLTPSNCIDLHVHTFFSDGKYAPEDILCRSVQLGIQTIAFTDHDNTRGVRQGMSMARELGIELIAGIEFTCSWPECSVTPNPLDVDLLGYFVDLDDPGFQALEQAALEDVYARVADCCAALKALGFAVEMEDVFNENVRYAGLVQLQQALLYKGQAKNWDAAAELIMGAWPQVRRATLTVEQAIAGIHRAGGVAVLAHPAALTRSGTLVQPADIARLVEAGLDGMEVYHRSARGNAREYFQGLAQRFGLLVSGGSDEHGWLTGLDELGSQPVTVEMLAALRTRHTQICRRRPAAASE